MQWEGGLITKYWAAYLFKERRFFILFSWILFSSFYFPKTSNFYSFFNISIYMCTLVKIKLFCVIWRQLFSKATTHVYKENKKSLFEKKNCVHFFPWFVQNYVLNKKYLGVLLKHTQYTHINYKLLVGFFSKIYLVLLEKDVGWGGGVI